MIPLVLEMAKRPQKPRAYSYVRFSRPEQMRGDSLRRQLELSREYAAKHGLELDDALTDLGVSAFRGKNSTEGALAGFLAAVREGSVKKGSTLLIESLDRLSRQEVEEALSQFLAIINAGIVIVTLADGQRYEKHKLELTQLIISLTVMSRAHEEIAVKRSRYTVRSLAIFPRRSFAIGQLGNSTAPDKRAASRFAETKHRLESVELEPSRSEFSYNSSSLSLVLEGVSGSQKLGQEEC